MFNVLGTIIGWIISAIAVWVSQKIVLEERKEKGFVSCLGLTLSGTILGWILGFIPLIGWLLSIITWLLLIKVWFDISWLRALVIAILAWIILIIMNVIVKVLNLQFGLHF